MKPVLEFPLLHAIESGASVFYLALGQQDLELGRLVARMCEFNHFGYIARE